MDQTAILAAASVADQLPTGDAPRYLKEHTAVALSVVALLVALVKSLGPDFQVVKFQCVFFYIHIYIYFFSHVFLMFFLFQHLDHKLCNPGEVQTRFKRAQISGMEVGWKLEASSHESS